LASPAEAHPHIWATVRYEVVFGPDHFITGIRHAWTFDEFYSATAVQGLDANGDGIFSKEELKRLDEVYVNLLQQFNYFTFVHMSGAGENLAFKPPEDYWLDYDEGELTFHFTLPFETPLDPNGKRVQIDVYDPSFFVAFGFAKEQPVKITGSPGCSVEIKLPDPREGEGAMVLSETFFLQLAPNSNFGAQFAQTALVKCGDAPS
jgi:ABC-type uncharacterized transport system substrate-binding protein